jgi:hypothetical protein
MKPKYKERRSVNIDKDDFIKIQDYCDRNSLKMSKWIAQIAIEKSTQNNIRTEIYQAIGEASMCWAPRPTGVFDSTWAGKIADRLYTLIKENKQYGL